MGTTRGPKEYTQSLHKVHTWQETLCGDSEMWKMRSQAHASTYLTPPSPCTSYTHSPQSASIITLSLPLQHALVHPIVRPRFFSHRVPTLTPLLPRLTGTPGFVRVHDASFRIYYLRRVDFIDTFARGAPLPQPKCATHSAECAAR